MKKNLLFVGLILLGIQCFNAQTVLQGTSSIKNGDILFGPKVGITFTQINGDELNSNGLLPGYQVGGAIEIPIKKEFYFAPEILFSLQGTRGDSNDLRLGYLIIPAMGKYHITDALAVEFGPQLGILISDNAEDFNFSINTIDLGLGIGGGYRINDNFYFQLRLNGGFLKVIDMVEATNIAVQVGVIYYLY